MFGFPSFYYPQQYHQPQYTRRAAPSYSSFDPFGFDTPSYPTHRPQQHTSLNPYYATRSAYQQNSDEDTSSSEECLQRRRVAPQRQVRPDKSPEQLSPKRKVKQLKRHPQQARQHPPQLQQDPQSEEEEDSQALPQLPPSQQDSQQPQRRSPQRNLPLPQPQPSHKHPSPPKSHPQTTHIPINIQRRVPQPVRKIDYDGEATRIQRVWRGWSVRKHDILNKFRSIKNIENEVDTIVAAPINQEILNLPLAEPLPSIDTNYVGKVPRCVLALEHELTTQLLALDGISGADAVRQRRKALVAKIEGILSRVDPVKKAYANSPHHPPQKVEPMEIEPSPSSSSPSSSSPSTPTNDSTPTITPSDTSATSTTDADTASSTAPSDMETEEDELEKKKFSESESDMSAHVITSTSGPRDAATTSEQAFVDSMGSLNISAPLSSPFPTPSPSSPSSSSSSAPSSPKTVSSVPPLKEMCFKFCDQLIKKAAVL